MLHQTIIDYILSFISLIFCFCKLCLAANVAYTDKHAKNQQLMIKIKKKQISNLF